MADIFVSYASADRDVAFRIVDFLEAEGIQCWVAPRDVAPGTEYGQAIIQAIEEAKALVLVLSDQSNESPFVRKEVERAVSKTKAIFPVRIREVTPSGSLEFYISSAQWVDAWKSPMEQHLLPLVAAIKAMGAPGVAPLRSAPASAPPSPPHSKSPLLFAVAGVVLLAAGIAGTLWYTNRTSTPGTPAVVQSAATSPAVDTAVDDSRPATSASVTQPASNASVPTQATTAPASATGEAVAGAPTAVPAPAAPTPMPSAAAAKAPPIAKPAAGPRRNDIAFVLGHWCQPYNGLTIRYEILRTGPDTILTRVNHPQSPNWDVATRVRPVAGGFDFQPVDEPATDANSSRFEIVDDSMMKLVRSEGVAQDGSIFRVRCAAE